MLGRGVNAILKHSPPSYPWGNTLSLCEQSDLRICNLECVLSDKGEPYPREKAFHFRTDTRNIDSLKYADINIVSLANNHTLDFGSEALHEMLTILPRHGVHFSGAGKDLKHAATVATASVNGVKIGMIAFTDNEPEWEAGKNKPGVFYVPINLKDKRAKYLLNVIKRAKKDLDLLIISAHWGPNWGYEVPKEHTDFAHRLIDAGADIIFGHSPHVFRGIEIYKQRPIIYSAGNFIDDYAVDEAERNDQSFIFIVEVGPPKISKLTLYPSVIENFQARLADDGEFEAEVIANKMMGLCDSMHTPTVWNSEDKYLEVQINND